MDLYNNDIKKRNKYQTDSTIRTASQKRLDRKIQMHLSQVEKFESQLFSKPMEKQPKLQIVKEEFLEKPNPNGKQVIDKLFKLCSNQNKISKALELMLRFFVSSESKTIHSQQIIGYLYRLLLLRIPHNSLYVKNIGFVTEIFQKCVQNKDLQQEHLAMIKLLQQFWGISSRLSSDDSFDFIKSLTDFYTMIQNFNIKKLDIDNYQDLLSLNQQIKTQQEPVPLHYSEQHLTYQKRRLIMITIQNLFSLGVNWKKTGVDQFMKKFNNDQKQRILHNKQRKRFQNKYHQYQSMRVLNSLDKQKQQLRDRAIKDSALKSSHDVKDGRVDIITLEGSDKWVLKQM